MAVLFKIDLAIKWGDLGQDPAQGKDTNIAIDHEVVLETGTVPDVVQEAIHHLATKVLNRTEYLFFSTTNY